MSWVGPLRRGREGSAKMRLIGFLDGVTPRRAFPGWRETDAGERGRALRRSDVLVENFRQGVLERLGFPASQLSTLNPRHVVLSITGFGDQGPEADRPGYDQIVQADSGLLSLTGPAPGVPGKIGVPITDLLAGIHGALGVVSALVRRQRTGRGGIVRTSLLASTVAAHSYHGTNWTMARHLSTGQSPHHPTIAPTGCSPAWTGRYRSPRPTRASGLPSLRTSASAGLNE
jgi:crotonobetainyl-CoA:carnitine CoA-transferase CaiB-like acyl-CoA transferase